MAVHGSAVFRIDLHSDCLYLYLSLCTCLCVQEEERVKNTHRQANSVLRIVIYHGVSPREILASQTDPEGVG